MKKNIIKLLIVICLLCAVALTIAACDNLRGTEIESESFAIDGDKLSTTVANDVETFSFANEIKVASNATYIVSTDLEANNVIRTKTVSLSYGDNTFYILVENGKDMKLYTAVIRRKPMYYVEFNVSGGTYCSSQYVEEGQLATEPSTTRDGYTFVGWNYDFSTPITHNTYVSAIWEAHTCTVTYDANGGIIDKKTETVPYGSKFIFAVPTMEGYTFGGWYVDDRQVAYADGECAYTWSYTEDKTITAKWNIGRYNLTINNLYSGAGIVTGAGTKVYNSEVTATATEPNLGYEWLGWYDGNELITSELSYTFNMPSTAVQLTANYKVKDEMSNFNFASTLATCEIIGINDKTVTEILVPTYVTSIKYGAFSDCGNLVNAVIPASVNSIGNAVFKGCNSLESISLPWTQGTYLGNLFSQFSASNNDCVPTSLKSVTITRCGYLANIEGEYLNDCVFLNCNNLTNIVIAASVKEIRGGVFSGCSSLESLTLPFVGYYDSSQKKYCPLGYLFGQKNYEGGVATQQYVYFFNVYGNLTSSMTTYYIPSSLKNVTITGGEIIYGDFRNCSGITSITIGDGVTTIGSSAFSGCSDLTNVIMGNNIATIGERAFSHCSKLTNIKIPDSVTSIGGYAFYLCGELNSVKMGNSVTSIGELAFNGCSQLTNVTIPDSVTLIGNNAFGGCDNLTSVFYEGKLEKWSTIAVGHSNANLTNATRYYYSETEPELNVNGTDYDGNYWHYDENGEIVFWTK